MQESRALKQLLAAHADLQRLTAEMAAARQRRRDAAAALTALGRGQTWIAAQLGVSPQAVDSFLKYKDRRNPSGPAGSD